MIYMKSITLLVLFLIWGSLNCNKPKPYYVLHEDKHIYALSPENEATVYAPYEAKPTSVFLPEKADISQIEERLPNCENPENALKGQALGNNKGRGYDFSKYIRQYYGIQANDRTFIVILIDQALFPKAKHPSPSFFKPQDRFEGSRGCRHIKGIISLNLNICTLTCDLP